MRKTPVNFSVDDNDLAQLERVSERLSLTRAEVSRRALRLGLQRLERVTLPGSVGVARRDDDQIVDVP